VHHAAQVGAAGVRRRGDGALDVGQAWEEAEQVGAAGGGAAAAAGLRVDAGDGHRQQQQRDAERRSRRHRCSLADWFLDWFFLRRCFVVGCGGFIALERRAMHGNGVFVGWRLL